MAKSTDPHALLIRPNEMVIHEGNFHQQCDPNLKIDGETRARGLIPRCYATNPIGSYKGIKPYKSVDLDVYAQSDWGKLCEEQQKAGRRNSDFRRRGNKGKPIPARDQGNYGYCWQHSGVGAMLVRRAGMNEDYADLSAYGPACVQKNFRNEGGWGAAGVAFLMSRGCPTSKTWPQQGTKKSYDKPETWAEAAKYKVSDGWIDMADPDYSRNLTFAQFATLWLMGFPTVNDYNWWGHSVCGCDLVDGSKTRNICRDPVSGKLLSKKDFEAMWDFDNPVTAGFGCRILNSWGDGWSDLGEGVLTGNRAVPDGGVGLGNVTASAA